MLAVADKPYLFARPPAPRRPLELSVVVPTLNEAGNVARLVDRLEAVLGAYEWEVVFVDDGSSDGTPQLLTRLAQRDRRVRVLRRFGRRGLASAVIEGAFASTAPFVAVIDADLQHDETVLPQLIAAVAERCDLAVGSRYARGGSLGEWSKGRARISRLATRLAELVVDVPLADPMSGFFVLRREAFAAAAPHLTGTGYKILLDLISSSPSPLRIVEVPYRFRPREVGESKLDAAVALEFAALLADKLLGRRLPLGAIAFALAGTLGLAVHLGVLGCLLRVSGLPFAAAAAIAAAAAATFDFALRNASSHRERRLRGARLAAGLARFLLACGLGGAADVGIAVLLRDQHAWWLAGGAGGLLGSLWNLAVGKLATASR